MSKHTEGPWIVFKGGNFVKVGTQEYVDRVMGARNLSGAVCEMEINFPFEVTEEIMANALLIAAAPDMLAALELVVNNCGNPNCNTCRTVRAVIAKAKGETP